MNLWDYLNASPFGAAVLALILTGGLARLVSAWRARSPVVVHTVTTCDACADQEHSFSEGR